jgi:hypothetical protein
MGAAGAEARGGHALLALASMRLAPAVLLVSIAVGCTSQRAPERSAKESPQDSPPPVPPEDPALVEQGSSSAASLEPERFAQRCVVATGYASEAKIGSQIDLGGASLGVFFEQGDRWQVPNGTRVEIRGTMVERADLPVFVERPGELAMQGIPVPEGTDLEEARKRWVIEHAEVVSFRSATEVEAKLATQVGQRVVLRGVLWSRNGEWWFVYDGVSIHLDRIDDVESKDHGGAAVLAGTLSRRPMPRIDQLGIHSEPELVESFVVQVETITAHPPEMLRECPAPTGP